MTMAYIRKSRGVPAKRGMRVLFTHNGRYGTIRSASGGYLRIQLDNDTWSGNYHPTWKIEYLDEVGNVIWPKKPDANALRLVDRGDA